MIPNPTELRYFDTKRMDQERKMVYGYFQDAIRAYGKDVKYYKMESRITGDGRESSELGYGFDPHRRVAKVADLRAYISFDTYAFQFNQFGFEPKSELRFFFSLNDFAVAFIDNLGAFRKFDVKPVRGHIPYNGEDRIRLPFECEITSGLVEFAVPADYDGRFLDGSVVEMYEPVYQIKENPYTHRTYTSDYHGNYFVPSIRASFVYGKVSGADYLMEGSMLYSGYDEARDMSDIIRPGIGDVIEVPYNTEDNHVEQYEISQVLDRLPTTGNSISYLMGRYVWQCYAVRRVASTGDAVETTEEATRAQDSISAYEESRERANRRENYDWRKSSDDDRVYGSYDTPEKLDMSQDRAALAEDADGAADYKVTSKEELDPEKKEGWKIVTAFPDGNMLTTDGQMLFFEKCGRRVLVKGFECPDDIVFRREHGKRAYLASFDGNLHFVNADRKVVRITSFEPQVAAVKSRPDGGLYVDDDVEMQDNWYIFKSSKMALFSKDDELICASAGGEEEVLASL